MFEVNNIKTKRKEICHIILACDENGIFDAFRIIKKNLGGNDENYLTLIYSVSKDYKNPLFEKEIAILEKRFSHHLYSYTIRIEPGKFEPIQGLIEAVINSNTNIEMQFLIFGSGEFVDYVTGVLKYLNIDSSEIKTEITIN